MPAAGPSVKQWPQASGLPAYRNNWMPMYTARTPPPPREWANFYHYWWGPQSPGKADIDAVHSTQQLGNRVLQVNAPNTWLSFLSGSPGRILITPEYESLYDRLVLAHRDDDYLRIVLCGQPGIGKSHFITYALLRRMAEGQPVLFTLEDGRTFLFDEFGVASKRKDLVRFDDLPPFNDYIHHLRPWSLIDANTQGKLELSWVTEPVRLFAVLAAPPLWSIYRKWLVQGTRQFVMDRWTDEEIRALLMNLTPSEPALQEQLAAFHDIQKVQELVAWTGPCPRDILLYLKDKSEWEATLRQNLDSLSNPEEIVDLIHRSISAVDKVSQSLMLLRSTKSSEPLQSDAPYICLKSRFIALKMQECFQYLNIKSAEWLFERFCTFAFEGEGIFLGWIFEALASGYLSGQQTAVQTIFCQFALMTRILGANDHFQHFQHEGTPLRAFIEVDSASGSVKYASCNPKDDTTSYNCNLQPSSLPLAKRKVVYYHDIASLQLDGSSYYVPLSRNNPLFDSFFLHISPHGVDVWVFQMAMAKEHGRLVNGVEQLQKIITTLRAPNVNVKYVLVAPHKRGEGVKWLMPQGWEQLPGEVYVQYVDFSAFFVPTYNDLFTVTPY